MEAVVPFSDRYWERKELMCEIFRQRWAENPAFALASYHRARAELLLSGVHLVPAPVAAYVWAIALADEQRAWLYDCAMCIDQAIGEQIA